ncbi:MAG: SelB C-terminal domain-containing protein, partial [Planctomycetes bacterium]|nr:SelB C-terminal domain-containing protein [Planctomycetota bacterium]
LLSEGGGMVLRHGRVTLESFQPALSARQIELRETIIQQVLAGGINPPARGSLKDELNIPEKEMKVLLKLLKEEGLLVQMGPNLLAKEIYDDCRQKLIDLCQENDTVMLSEFRKATGASRNLSVAILESFDQAGLTRRVEDGRQLARKP